ncbi:MAG: cation:proton antiporter [Gammaproteobacteria bacterium]|nr:cation:proton antiporter [Gammaproteobacteria bacterium]
MHTQHSIFNTGLFGSLLLFFPFTASANNNGMHTDPIAPVILGVTGILLFALIGRFIARRFGQPSVLGELIMGVILGNIGYYFGSDFITVLREGPAIFDMFEQTLSGVDLQTAAIAAVGEHDAQRLIGILNGPDGAELIQVAHTVDIFSRYGVIFLLFLVGLDTSIGEMRAVGSASLRVAVVGVVLPFVLGFAAARVLMPELSVSTDLFVAATLGATSIGITASVLKEMNKSHTQEAHIILGAAVIDDILGLVMLAIVTGIIVSGSVDVENIVITIGWAALFLVTAFAFGPILIRKLIEWLRHLDIVEAKMFVSFMFVMVLAWLANFVGLATIVGAFAAGVIMQDAYFKYWGDSRFHKISIKDLISPLEAIMVPIFFVVMGIQVKLESFLDEKVGIMASGLLLAAIVGKILCGFVSSRGTNRLAIGIGMLPRGEVGLIFASIGTSLGVISDALFSAIVLMVITTTLIVPPLLKWGFRRI